MQRKVRAILMIAVLLTAMLMPMSIFATEETTPEAAQIETAQKAEEKEEASVPEPVIAPEEETAEPDQEIHPEETAEAAMPDISEEMAEEAAQKLTEGSAEEPTEELAEEAAEEPTEELIEEAAEEPTEELTEEAAEEPTEEPTEEPETFESDPGVLPTEDAAGIDYSQSADANRDFVSGYAQVLPDGAVVYDSAADDRVQTDYITSGVVYVLERTQGSWEALYIAYLQDADRIPATGWISPDQVRPMEPETEVEAYLEKGFWDETAVCWQESVWLMPVECESAKEHDTAAVPEVEAAEVAENEAALEAADEDGAETEDEVVIETADEAAPETADETAIETADEAAPEAEDEAVIETEDGVVIETEDEVVIETEDEVVIETEDEAVIETEDEAVIETEDEAVMATADAQEPEAPVTGYDEEVAAWAAQTGATDEMIQRARQAKSLDSLVLENDQLIYVRTGEVMAIYDAGTGILFDVGSALPVARLDVSSGMLYPLDNEG